MLHRRWLATLGLIVSLVGASLPQGWRTAAAADFDVKGKAEAKEATRLYKQGKYAEAAGYFAKLSVDYPDMPVFERNLGACFYYLNKPEPALSNLRNYLHHQRDIAPDDKAVVDRWIEEMEKLKTQNAAASLPPAPPPTEAPSSPTIVPTPSLAVPPQAGEVPISAASPPPSLPMAPAPVEPTSKPEGPTLASTPAASEVGTAAAPYYKRSWFWGTVTAVLAAGAITAVVLSTRKTESNVPSTPLGNQGGW
jgi:hypothetical protein